ncbi:unnamed protein product [Coffea canephora]|uniref:Transmembrane protein n=1 Tax=Coffea canephora TaxID=49390 RepID=A0A068UT33_COFCA|nr:unnamed protein product [Coffea canephora]
MISSSKYIFIFISKIVIITLIISNIIMAVVNNNNIHHPSVRFTRMKEAKFTRTKRRKKDITNTNTCPRPPHHALPLLSPPPHRERRCQLFCLYSLTLRALLTFDCVISLSLSFTHFLSHTQHALLFSVLCSAPLCCCLLAFGGTYSLLVASGGFQSFSLLLLSGGFKDKRFGSWASGFLTDY